MTAKFLIFASFLSVSACATGRQAATSDPPIAADRARAAEAASPRQATRLDIARPQGWRQTEAADGSTFFLSNRARAVIRFSLRPAEGTPAETVAREASRLAEAGNAVGPVDAAADAYASVDWSGDLGAGPRRGCIAVRRPAGSPGSFIVMSAYWPADADPGLADEVGLIMLLTTAQ